MIFALNGSEFGSFGELGAARSQSVMDLQSALVALGNGIRDGVLMKVAVDGLIGPKTAAATNRAMTVHLGPGQAPANLRTGSLSQSEIVSQADALTNLIETEIKRRGFSAPKAKKVSSVASKPKAAAPKAVATTALTTAYAPTAPAAPGVTAASPVYRVPAVVPKAAAGGMDMTAIMKWSAIGVGAVVVAGIAYYLLTKPAPRMAGFAGEGERGHPFKLRWFPANQAYGVVWGDQVIDVHGQRFFATKAEAKYALTQAGLKLVGKNTVVSAESDEGTEYNRDLALRLREKPFRMGRRR